jgi:hypothetical protein
VSSFFASSAHGTLLFKPTDPSRAANDIAIIIGTFRLKLLPAALGRVAFKSEAVHNSQANYRIF